MKYAGTLSAALAGVKSAGGTIMNGPALLTDLCEEIDRLKDSVDSLSDTLEKKPAAEAPVVSARYMHDQVLPAMVVLRSSADRLEQITDRSCWPFPTYDELLFSIQ